MNGWKTNLFWATCDFRIRINPKIGVRLQRIARKELRSNVLEGLLKFLKVQQSQVTVSFEYIMDFFGA